MTDKEKLAALFTEFGIGFFDHETKIEIDVMPDSNDRESLKVKGYSGFATEFNFDENGKFIDVYIWE
jgi:hypothetical protein